MYSNVYKLLLYRCMHEEAKKSSFASDFSKAFLIEYFAEERLECARRYIAAVFQYENEAN